jgi:glycosyltransferase involved in cell wall biosynthesis
MTSELSNAALDASIAAAECAQKIVTMHAAEFRSLSPNGDMHYGAFFRCKARVLHRHGLICSGLVMALQADSSNSQTLRSLQLGMGWFPQKAGGCNRVYFNLMQHLPGAGVLADGIVAGENPLGSTTSGVAAFARNDAPLPFRLLKARHAIRARDTSQYDLVCSHFALYTLPMLEELRSMPMVVHFHGPWAAEGAVQGDLSVVRKAKLWVERRVYGQAVRFIVLSSAFARVLAESYGVPEERINLVPGGVECGRFQPQMSKADARQRLGYPKDRPIVFVVRRLASRMGLQDLISATALVRARVPDVMVLIAGKGPLGPRLQQQIDEMGLSENIRLLGFMPEEDLPLAYWSADLSVVPTVALEGFGLVVAEALAAGVPPLVTPVGGLPEVVRALSPDLILPATGVDALAEGISSALVGRLRLPGSVECQNFARRYDWTEVAAKTAAIYRTASQ